MKTVYPQSTEMMCPVQMPQRLRLTARWLLDENGKLYCKWITDSTQD